MVILFDLDGTLLNTDRAVQESFKHAFSVFLPEYHLSQDELLSFLGPSLRASFSRYLPEDQVEDAMACYREHNYIHHPEHVTLYTAEKEALEELKELGCRMAVITTKKGDIAHYGLSIFDMEDYFEFMISGEDVTRHKPDPEGIVKALEKMGTKDALYVGDNVSDIKAAQAAGILSAGVTWSPKGRSDLDDLHPDLMIDSFRDLVAFYQKSTEKRM